MKIKIQTAADSLTLENGRICALADGTEYFFDISEVEELLIITNDLGPLYDDMCLAVRINAETAIFIMSEHPCYTTFLFDGLGKALDIDYNVMIKASTCIENNVFLIYERSTP